MMYSLLALHILGATIWTGGHLILAIAYLPQALKTKDVSILQSFEGKFERLGIPALVIQIATGLYMAHILVPDYSQWFDFSNPATRIFGFKVVLILTTLGLALDARLRVIPKLTSQNIVSLAYHIIPVTIISVLLVLLGASFRYGGF